MRKVAIMFTALLLTAPTAFAQRGGGLGGGGGGGGMKMMQELSLTDTQQAALRALHADHRKAMVRLEAELEIKTIDFHTELQKDTSDPGLLAKLTDEIVAQEGNVVRERLEHQAKMMAIFTPEQKAKLAARMSQRMMRGPGAGGGGGGRQGGPGGGGPGGFGGPPPSQF